MLMPNTNRQMKVSAARMAAEGEDPELNGFKQAAQGPQTPAPVSPTTNAQVAQKRAAPQMAKPMAAPPGFGGTIGGSLVNGGQTAAPVGVNNNTSTAQSRSDAGANQAVIQSSGSQNTAQAQPVFDAGVQASQLADLKQKTDAARLAAAQTGDLTSAREGQIDNSIDGLLNGNYDTTADKQAITDSMNDQASRGQLDLEAKLGASGFGVSGAAMAGITNLRTKAARDAALQMEALDQQARVNKRADIGLGFSENNFNRQQANTDAKFQSEQDAALTANGQIIDHDGNKRDDTTGLTQEETEAKAIRMADYQHHTKWNGDVRDAGEGQANNPFTIPRAVFGQASSDLGLKLFKTIGADQIYRGTDGKFYVVV